MEIRRKWTPAWPDHSLSFSALGGSSARAFFVFLFCCRSAVEPGDPTVVKGCWHGLSNRRDQPTQGAGGVGTLAGVLSVVWPKRTV